MPHAANLAITHCSWLCDDDVAALARAAGWALRKVDLSSNPSLTDASVVELVASCPALTTLLLMSCHALTDEGRQRALKSNTPFMALTGRSR